MTLSQSSRGKTQDSMEGEERICYGAIPGILDPILVGCLMSWRKLWQNWEGGGVKVDVHNTRRIFIREYGCAKQEGEE